MKIPMGKLRIGEPFKYQGEYYLPINAHAGKLYALKLSSLTAFDMFDFIETDTMECLKRRQIDENI